MSYGALVAFLPSSPGSARLASPGLFFTLIAVGLLVIRTTAGRLSDCFGRPVVVAPGLAVVAAALLVVALARAPWAVPRGRAPLRAGFRERAARLDGVDDGPGAGGRSGAGDGDLLHRVGTRDRRRPDLTGSPPFPLGGFAGLFGTAAAIALIGAVLALAPSGTRRALSVGPNRKSAARGSRPGPGAAAHSARHRSMASAKRSHRSPLPPRRDRSWQRPGRHPSCLSEARIPSAGVCVASLARPGGVHGLSWEAEPRGAREGARVRQGSCAWNLARRGPVGPHRACPTRFLRGGDGVRRSTARGLALHLVTVRQQEDLAAAFAAIERAHVDALVWCLTFPDQPVANFAARRKLPSVGCWREAATEGALMSYGPSAPDLWRRAATYVDRILKGARPARSPRRAAHQVRAGDQHTNRKDPRPRDPVLSAGARGRAARVARGPDLVGPGAPDPRSTSARA